jgi:hypothetical protein
MSDKNSNKKESTINTNYTNRSPTEDHATIKFDDKGNAHDKDSGKFVTDEHVNRSLSHEKDTVNTVKK